MNPGGLTSQDPEKKLEFHMEANDFVITGDSAHPATLAPPDIITVTATEGRTLLRITHDGQVDGAIEDMGEAARLFVTEVRRLATEMGLRIP